MKNTLRILGLLGLFLFAISCGKSTNPVNKDLFVGTYNGSVGYSDNHDDIKSDNSAITVIKVGRKYNFQFKQAGIPALNGIEFNKKEKGAAINVDFKNGVRVIRIDANNLTIDYSKDGEKWTAKAKR